MSGGLNLTAPKTIYVDALDGLDSNQGTDVIAPVRSLSVAYSRMLDGDKMLLKRGCVWTEPLGNRDSAYRWQLCNATVGAYGSGARPIVSDGLKTGACINRQGGGGTRDQIDGNTFSDIELRPSAGGQGVCWLGGGKGLVLSGLLVVGGLVGIKIQGDGPGVIERPMIVDSEVRDQCGTGGHAQGIFIGAANCQATLRRVKIRNVGMDKPDIFRQGLYITEGSGYCTVEDCEFDLCSSHGAQVRSGGSVRRNVFKRCGLALFVGWDASTGTTANIVEENLVYHGRDIAAGVPRAMGIEIQGGHETYLRRNTVANKLPGANPEGYAFKVTGNTATDPEAAISVWESGNVWCNWGTGGGIWGAAANVAYGSERAP